VVAFFKNTRKGYFTTKAKTQPFKIYMLSLVTSMATKITTPPISGIFKSAVKLYTAQQVRDI